jgi:predicted alpha/beta hydrolase family esterase
MKKVLFLHGWSSDGGTKTAFLRSLGYDVLTPRLSDWSFARAVAQAQEAYDQFHPDVIVGSSRGGAVAINMDSGETPLILLAPAWKKWGQARSVKSGCVVIHSPHDEFVPYSDSVELCGKSGSKLVAAGKDHRLNCWEGRMALNEALELILPFGDQHPFPTTLDSWVGKAQ